MVGIQESPELTFDDAYSYITAVREAFEDEPAIFQEFSNLLTDYTTRRLDSASLITKMKELLKDHPELLPGFGVFQHKAQPLLLVAPESKTTFSPEAKTITPPKPRITFTYKGKRTRHPEAEDHAADSNCTKRKRVESNAYNFLDKLKTRFRSLDTHKLRSFYKILKKFHEGKMSEERVYNKVYQLLYFHDDLIDEFSNFLSSKPR